MLHATNGILLVEERMAFSLKLHKLSFSHCFESKMKKGSSTSSYDESKMHEYEFAFQTLFPIFFLMHKYMFEYSEQMISCHLPNFKPIGYITVCQEDTLELTFKICLTNIQNLIYWYYKRLSLQTGKYTTLPLWFNWWFNASFGHLFESPYGTKIAFQALMNLKLVAFKWSNR